MIPQQFIQDLLNRVDVVEVVDRYVKLKRAGSNYSACCPFHSEKSPSFTVSPTKQFYHCFGCGAHGTAISFLMEYGGMGFIDAVKELAQSVGMKVPEVPRSDQAAKRAEQSDDLHGVLLTAARFYRARLRDSKRAIEYLKRRGLSGDIAKRFGIGYAPEEWQNLAAAFSDYNAKSLVTAGLVKDSGEGKRFDLFRDRIIFPIVDVRGNVIGFGGRVLEQGEPKYLNSPETPVFEKGRELYGLYQARRSIRDAGRVLVVEGYMDVVALAQHGIEYAVATLGTATTPTHVQKLLRQTDDLVFCFDGDTAGRRAAWRALESSLPALTDGKQVRFLFLPQGEDPDTYVRRVGKEGFEALLGDAVPLSRFLLERLSAEVDLSTAEGRASLIHSAKPLVTQLQNNTFRVQIIHDLAQTSHLSPGEVEVLCGLASGQHRRLPTRTRSKHLEAMPEWQHLIKLILEEPQLARHVTDQQRTLLERRKDFAAVLRLIGLITASDLANKAAVFEAVRGTPEEALYEGIAADTRVLSPTDLEKGRAEFADVLKPLELGLVTEEWEQLRAKANRTHAEEARWQILNKRLAELKGVPPVAAVPPR